VSVAHEVNFDGIVGPTHHYGGLAYGNVASMRNKQSVSHPKQAALQGLAKMKFMADLGLKQAVLPPHERPHVPTLRRIGYTGSDAVIIEIVAKEDPWLLSAASNASAMWAANAATVSPSADTSDGRIHFTPANLVTQFHRSIEAATTTTILRRIFANEKHFVVHEPLPATPAFADEGAANHTRLWCPETEGTPGLEVFVYGRRASGDAGTSPSKFPARQTYEACAAIARRHQIRPDHVLFLRQNPAVIDAGAFHNDVVAVGNREIMLYHGLAYADANVKETLESHGIESPTGNMPLEDAIRSYVFNSQYVTLPDDSFALIAPVECLEVPSAKAYVDGLIQYGAVHVAHFVDVRQSMRNGGGPACLRLRVVLTDDELAAAHQGVIFTDALYASLQQWVEKHYRDELTAADLADPTLLDESRTALDALTRILRLGPIYEFQR
jgi:succinylarginine dihydrolase